MKLLIVVTTTWLWSLSNQTRDGGTERRGEESILCLNFLWFYELWLGLQSPFMEVNVLIPPFHLLGLSNNGSFGFAINVMHSLCIQNCVLVRWIKIDQLDITYFIISLFTTQHVSNVSRSIFRSLRLIMDLFHVLYCSGSMCVGVTVWFSWGGVVSLSRLKQCFSNFTIYCTTCFEC